MITRVPKLVNKAERLLAPLIEERRKCMEMYGDDWADKPVRLLSIFAFRLQLMTRASFRRMTCFNG